MRAIIHAVLLNFTGLQANCPEPIADAHELLLALTPADETQVLRDSRVRDYLTLGIVLHGMEIIPDRSVTHYTLADDNGWDFVIDVHAVPPGGSSKLNWISVVKEPPLFRQKPDDDFWYTYLQDSRTVYCSFRGYKDLGKQSKGLFDLIKQQNPDKLVIDMRLNGGGDYNVGLKHLVHPIRDLPDTNRKDTCSYSSALVRSPLPCLILHISVTRRTLSWWDTRSERNPTATRKPAR